MNMCLGLMLKSLCFAMIFVLSVIPIQLISQVDSIVFKYMENNVKTIHLSKTERLDYEYNEGVIIERQDLSLGAIVERFYYYSSVNKLDSIIYQEIYEDTIYVSKDYYYYDEGSLKIIQRGEDIENEIIRIDSFSYRPDGLVEKAYYLANKVETVFGTKQIDSIRLQNVVNYYYGSDKVLSRQSWGDKTRFYQYDENGRLLREHEILGKINDGCIQRDERLFCTIRYQYNQLGLVTKKVFKYFIGNPDGKLKKNGRVVFRQKYEYY